MGRLGDASSNKTAKKKTARDIFMEAFLDEEPAKTEEPVLS